MILVTGAAGKTGQAVIRALTARQLPVRALIRRQTQVLVAQAAGAREVVVGDMRETAVLRQAARNIQAVYHICPNMSPDEVVIGRALIEAVREDGGAHFVYHSVLHPQTEKMPHHWLKLRVEELLLESGLEFTILQPAAYMQNMLQGWTAITTLGIYRVPYAVTARLSLVDLLDVAEAAAITLTQPEHRGGIYELAGPALSPDEVAATLAQQLGRPVHTEEIPIETWRRQAEAVGLGDYQLETLAQMFEYYRRYGFSGNAWTLSQLLGRPPTSLEAFVARTLTDLSQANQS